MANLSVSNTFVAATVAVASQVNTNFSDVVTYINARNSGGTSWDALAVSGTSTLTGAVTASSTLDVTGVTTLLSTLAVTGVATFSASPIITTSAASSRSVKIVVNNAVGDPYLWFLTDATDWTLGVDNSDADAFVISKSVNIGTDNTIRIATNGDITIPGTLTVTGVTTLNGVVTALGTTTNDSAAQGYIGEYVVATDSSMGNMAASTTWQDQVSISLTAGDWDVYGSCVFNANGATVTQGYGTAISIHSGNTTTDHVNGNNVLYGGPAAVSLHASTTVIYRLSIASTTTVYLKTVATYSGGPPQALGTLKARRVR